MNSDMKISNRFMKLCSAAVMLVLSLAFTACSAGEASSLRAFAKPYLGRYECMQAKLGERDLLGQFRTLTLTLEGGGSFLYEAVPKEGKKTMGSGLYEYDGEGDTITFIFKEGGKTYKKDVLFENGTFVIEQMLAGQKLVMRFETKL